MKAVMLFLWGIVLFIFTCAADSSFWSKGVMPYFHLTPGPDFRNLLQMDIRYTELFPANPGVITGRGDPAGGYDLCRRGAGRSACYYSN